MGLLLFRLYTSELFPILENKLISYADDSTLSVLPSPGVRVTVAESMHLTTARLVSCNLLGKKLKISKTKTVIISRSRTMNPQSPPLTIGETVLKESDVIDMLGVTFDTKMTFEKHRRSVFRADSHRPGILKSYKVFHDRLLLRRCFRGFVLPVLEYFSAVWCSAADIHQKLLDHVVSGPGYFTGVCLSVTSHIVDLWQYYVSCTIYYYSNGRFGSNAYNSGRPNTRLGVGYTFKSRCKFLFLSNMKVVVVGFV